MEVVRARRDPSLAKTSESLMKAEPGKHGPETLESDDVVGELGSPQASGAASHSLNCTPLNTSHT